MHRTCGVNFVKATYFSLVQWLIPIRDSKKSCRRSASELEPGQNFKKTWQNYWFGVSLKSLGIRSLDDFLNEIVTLKNWDPLL